MRLRQIEVFHAVYSSINGVAYDNRGMAIAAVNLITASSHPQAQFDTENGEGAQND